MLLLWSAQLPTLISESEIKSCAVDKGLYFVIQFVWLYMIENTENNLWNAT